MTLNNSGEDNVIKITNYFKIPKLSTISIFLLLTLAIFSYSIHRVNGLSLSRSVASAFFVIVLPTLLTILTFSLLIHTSKTRIQILIILTSLSLSLIYTFGLLFKDYFFYIIVIGYGILVFSWYLLLNLVFGFKKSAVLLALIMITYYSIFLLIDNEFRTEGFIEALLKIYLSSVVFLIGVLIMFVIINAPMKRRFGIKSTDAITQFSQQWLEGKKMLENYFKKIGTTVETDVKILSFKRRDDIVNLIIPNVHFGPFGNLGGSRFSYIISKGLPGNNVILHGTVTHDFDPVSTEQVKPILDACNDILDKIKYKKGYFKYIKMHSRRNQHSKTYEMIYTSIDMLIFNEHVLTGLSLHPTSSEDIEYGIGLALTNYLKSYRDTVAVYDEHNSDIGHVTPVKVGHPSYNEFIKLINKAKKKERTLKKQQLNIGFSEISISNKSLGSAGIKCIVFGNKKNSEINSKIAMVVLDSNNITPKTKTAIENLIKNSDMKIEHVIVSTTDTHENNSVKGVVNPFDQDDFEKLKGKILECVKKAYEDMRPANVGFGEKIIELDVLGPGVSTEIVSIFNSLISIVKIIIPILLVSATIIILLALKKMNV